MLSDAAGKLDRGLGEARPNTDNRRRVEVIVTLLERYNELIEPLQAGQGNGQTGLLLMPATYTPSVRELERVLRRMRDDRHSAIVKWEANGERFAASPRRLWWHANAWWIDVQRALYVPPLKPRKNRRKQLARQPVDQHGAALPQVRVLRKAEARYQIALKAAEYIADHWQAPFEPMLPDELRDAA